MKDDLNTLAVDLMIEDLHTVHNDIRIKAKDLGCEKNLDEIKDKVLEYLYQIRS